MELLKLLGIVIVIAGFALKLDSILVILVAAVVTALVGGLGPVTLLETLGSTFVANRSMAIFIIVMLVTGTLERNGLREAAAALIGKFKGATSGLVIGIYGVMRSIFAAFNVGFGGVAGFVRPVRSCSWAAPAACWCRALWPAWASRWSWPSWLPSRSPCASSPLWSPSYSM